jgi:hypothetical protein
MKIKYSVQQTITFRKNERFEKKTVFVRQNSFLFNNFRLKLISFG